MANEGELLWTPDAARCERSHVRQFMNWLERERGLRFADYQALWRWSIDDLSAFWRAIWDYFEVRSSTPVGATLTRTDMPGAQWFPGVRLNYAAHILARERPGRTALISVREGEPLRRMSWDELAAQVRIVATQLRQAGVRPGDRVAAVLPNTPQAVIAALATTSLGAIWSCCGPDYGTKGVLERFTQLAPKVFIYVDGYQYGGKRYERQTELTQVLAALDSVELAIRVVSLGTSAPSRATRVREIGWDELLDHAPVAASAFHSEPVPFDHPLWILFSSGTTGLPKPIVHGHGGILLEHLKHMFFNYEARRGEPLFFFTTTSWMIWNFLLSTLAGDVIPVLYDGNPAYPGPDALWKVIEESGATLFGTSPTFIDLQRKAGIVPREQFRLGKLEGITLAGSPVTAECMEWVYQNVKSDLWVASGSGGTDCCTGFVGGVSLLPVYAGEIQARALGCAAFAFDEVGREVIDAVGELVITRPMPSMPVKFWNDPGDRRYRETYFDSYPGIWRHGDFVRFNQRGGAFVLGRSDATLNRHGVRIGTAEIYRSLALLAELDDTLIVNLDLPGGKFFMPLFVKLRGEQQLDEAIVTRIRARLLADYSPRHVPDKVYQVPAIPYTISGKKLEVPIRRILMGVDPDRAANRSALANPAALEFFIDYARTQQDYPRS